MSTPAHPVLAQHPARQTWTIGAARRHASRLVDRAFADFDGAGRGAARPLHRERAQPSECPLDAAAHGAAWTSALRAHQQRRPRDGARGLRARARAAARFRARALLLRDRAARRRRERAARASARRGARRRARLRRRAHRGGERGDRGRRPRGRARALRRRGSRAAAAQALVAARAGPRAARRSDGAAAAERFARALRARHGRRRDALQPRRRAADAAATSPKRRGPTSARSRSAPISSPPTSTSACCSRSRAMTDAAIAAYAEVLRADPAQRGRVQESGRGAARGGRIDALASPISDASRRTARRRCRSRCRRSRRASIMADFAKLERYLDGLRQERFARAERGGARRLRSRSSSTCCSTSTSSRRCSLPLRADLRRDGARTSTASRCRGRRRGGPGRVRIGYLSGDLRNHVMGKMMWQAIAASRPRALRALLLFAVARATTSGRERFAASRDHFDVARRR